MKLGWFKIIQISFSPCSVPPLFSVFTARSSSRLVFVFAIFLDPHALYCGGLSACADSGQSQGSPSLTHCILALCLRSNFLYATPTRMTGNESSKKNVEKSEPFNTADGNKKVALRLLKADW